MMNRLLLLSLVCASALFPLQAEEFRQWTTIGGGQFEAKLNGTGSRTVELENREGKVIEFPIADLKPSDQAYARDWQLEQSGDGTAGDGTATAAAAERSAFAKRVHRDLLVEKNGRLVRYAPETATPPKYYAFYRSAMWCPPCRAFTPDLVKFYKSQKRRDAPFELIFISSDRGEPAMIEYMEEYKMPWPAFPYDENKDIVERNGTGIPSLIVTDADGNKLLDSYDRSGNYIGPRSVMADLEDLLEKP